MRQCIFVLGTRAQLVKIAPVLQLAAEQGLKHVVWFTGQHQESIDDLVSDFELTSPFEQPKQAKERSSIVKLLTWLPGTLHRCYRYVHSVRIWTGKTPLVIVHGDTLSTYLGALAGSWGGGQVVHLESGLSSGKLTDPFPEEILRRLTFRRTKYAFCPNDAAAERMQKYDGCIVINTEENTLLDCVRYALARHRSEDELAADFVVSIHRFQNIYKRERLEEIVAEIIALAEHGSVWFILHPPTEIRLKKYGLYDKLANSSGVRLMNRLPYSEFLALMGKAKAVFTDGGSNQEELSYLGVPTVLYRERSERPDGLGANIRFRHEFSDTPAACFASGELDALRAESRMDDGVQPSQMTVDALARWTGSSGNKGNES